MQTHGYERSKPWTLALNLLTHAQSLTAEFGDDRCGLAGKMLAIASDLPVRAAITFEQNDYQTMQQHADVTGEQTLELLLHAQVAEHLKLLSPRAVADLRKRLNAFDRALTDLPDLLFEDDGEETLAAAA